MSAETPTAPPNIFEILQEGDRDKLAAVLEADPTIARVRDAEGLSPVLLACYMQRQDLVDLLLEADPPLDFFDAAAVGNDSLLRDYLLEDEEIVRRENFDGFTALHLAAFFGHEISCEVLLGAGADPNAVTPNDGRLRPLNSAVNSGVFEIVELLLDYGADPNVAQQGGWTPLMSAAHRGDLSVTWLLIERGADAGATADNGQTALALAEDAKQSDVVDWLRQNA